MILPEDMSAVLHAIADEIDRRARLIQQDDRSAPVAAAGLVSGAIRSTADRRSREERSSD